MRTTCRTCRGEGWRWVVVADGEVVRRLVELGCPECAAALEAERYRRTVPAQRRRRSPEVPDPVTPAEGARHRAELLAAVLPLQGRRQRPPAAGGAA